ncbi:hypothetical protein WK52_27710 [Burkholderia multivorans]|nr:hypothetical protein WK52_27710 [Burkholderia multivorans]
MPAQARTSTCARATTARHRHSKSPATAPASRKPERAHGWARFYRDEGAQTATSSGSGLGLSIVKRIAEQHRATVALGTTRDGRGLTVSVRFPDPT